MAIEGKPDVNVANIESNVKKILAKFQIAKAIKDNWTPVFEECYELALPQRESFYTETIGSRRTDHIFDETAVVSVQEFASRLQSGIVPNYARWAEFIAGTEVPKDQQKETNLSLDEITEYVFEVLQNSNFSQEVHETFLDCAVGTGILLVEEGDAVQPIRFKAIPLPQVCITSGYDDKIDAIYRTRKIKLKEALKHPNWSMGKKITIDSSTMMNKVFEVIETNRIFNIGYNKISILTHKKSYLHAIIEFNNGLIKSLVHETDMKIPIFNSLYRFHEKKYDLKKLDLNKMNNLDLKKIDLKKFPLVKILKNYPVNNSLFDTVIISCNDMLVNLFLQKKISYTDLCKKLIKFSKIREFQKYKKIKPKNTSEIYDLSKYVSLKIQSMCV